MSAISATSVAAIDNSTPPRKWVPSIYVDETCPTPRDRPEDWILWNADGRPTIANNEDIEGRLPVYPLFNGDVVRFRSFVDWGTFELTIHPNGSWSCDRPIPAEANGFMEAGEPDTYADTIDEFARNWIDAYAIDEVEAGPVCVYYWSDDIYFRLDSDRTGKLIFIPVTVFERAGTFQLHVGVWMQACFGPDISADRLERGDRLLEEVLELLQSGAYPRERVAALENYVYERPKGEPAQEVGGVMVTLAAYCEAHGLDMLAAGDAELTRVWGKIEQIRAKQAAKPTGSALPIAQMREA